MSIFENLDWMIYGIAIGLFVPLTLIIGNKLFGLSSSLIHLCSLVIPKKISVNLLNYDFKEHKWKFYFVLGIILGGFIASNFLSSGEINFLPEEYYSLTGLIKLFIGGLLVGFGTRYANGCTSGHSITGLALLQKSSLAATVSFFIGGLIFTFINYFVL